MAQPKKKTSITKKQLDVMFVFVICVFVIKYFTLFNESWYLLSEFCWIAPTLQQSYSTSEWSHFIPITYKLLTSLLIFCVKQ